MKVENQEEMDKMEFFYMGEMEQVQVLMVCIVEVEEEMGCMVVEQEDMEIKAIMVEEELAQIMLMEIIVSILRLLLRQNITLA